MSSNTSILTFVLVLCCIIHETNSFPFDIDPDETLTFRELIASRGFVLEEYNVLTEDGYILKVDRVVPPNYDPSTYNVFRKPVIAMHGIFNDATYYYFSSPFLRSNNSYCGDNFGFCMVLSGRYDLWVPNSRGNGRSMGHIRYSTKDPRFWRFSWDHMGMFDSPAVIDFVREQTGHKTLGYVCFSQGCAQMFALLSLQPYYAKVIRPLIAWAPAVFISRANSVIAPALRNLHPIAMKPGIFPIGDPMMNSFFQWHFCRPQAGRELCNVFLNGFFGKSNINVTRIPTMANFAPSISSNWQVAHFGQNGQCGRFRRFNYPTSEENIAMYGRPTPPDYPLWNIPRNYKIIIMHGETDGMVGPADARQLVSILRSYGVDVTRYYVPSKVWSHADFLIGMGAGRLVYDETIRYLDLFAWDNQEWRQRTNFYY